MRGVVHFKAERIVLEFTIIDHLGFKDTVYLLSLTCLIEKTSGKHALSQQATLALSMISKVFYFPGQERGTTSREEGQHPPTHTSFLPMSLSPCLVFSSHPFP